VAFANNPVTGLFIVAGMFASNALVGWACLLAGILGVIFSKVLKQPEILINDGVSIFNGILVACIGVAVFPSISGHDLGSIFWLYIALAVCITAYIDKGLNALMASSTLPAFSLPFNLTAAILLLTMRSHAGLEGRQMPITSTFSANLTLELNITEALESNLTAALKAPDVEWSKVFEGTLLAAGQIYGVGTIDASILIYLGFFFYSPLLTVFFYFGSLIGTLIGVVACIPPYTEVYMGLWGYNSLLTAGGIAFFMVPTPSVTLASVVGAALAAGVQAATMHLFSPATVPVFSYPFNVATLLIVAISKTPNPPFHWIEERTYPEKHIILHYRKQKARKCIPIRCDMQLPFHASVRDSMKLTRIWGVRGVELFSESTI
ncbi:hypothetical protein SK128_027505, partial [Halocaridina rubra]